MKAIFYRLFMGGFRRIVLPGIVKNDIFTERKNEEAIVVKNFPKGETEPLTATEMQQVLSIWGGEECSFSELGLFKKHRGFDPRYMSHYFYLPIIAHKLNNYHYTKLFEHKSLLGHIANSELNTPYCYVRCIDQEYYDNEMNQISRQQAIEFCVRQDTLIVKDSVDSSGGKSVEKINMINVKDRKKEIERILAERKCDFVIQESISQHPSMSKFNESSINTLRVTTLYMNGQFSVCSIILRHGKKEIAVDNWGAGGIIIGVSCDGRLNEYGYDIKLNKYEGYNGVTYRNEVINQVPLLLKKIETAHKNQFSICKFIGWDICFNQDGEPIVIEVNSSQPGVIGEQLCTGPIFGDRTQEVIDYCKKKEFNYNKFLFRY